jgi:hypothetical protein
MRKSLGTIGAMLAIVVVMATSAAPAGASPGWDGHSTMDCWTSLSSG